MRRQGPHQVAQKSMKTGLSLAIYTVRAQSLILMAKKSILTTSLNWFIDVMGVTDMMVLLWSERVGWEVVR